MYGDGALEMHMLHHVTDPSPGIRELARVRAVDGIAVVSANRSRDEQELDAVWRAGARDVLGGGGREAGASVGFRP